PKLIAALGVAAAAGAGVALSAVEHTVDGAVWSWPTYLGALPRSLVFGMGSGLCAGIALAVVERQALFPTGLLAGLALAGALMALGNAIRLGWSPPAAGGDVRRLPAVASHPLPGRHGGARAGAPAGRRLRVLPPAAAAAPGGAAAQSTIAWWISCLSWPRKLKVADGMSWVMKMANRSSAGST